MTEERRQFLYREVTDAKECAENLRKLAQLGAENSEEVDVLINAEKIICHVLDELANEACR